MNRLHSFVLGALLLLTAASQAAALTAVVEVTENSWYQAEKATRYNGASFTRFYAPLPVFFEGWKSTPREDIVDWVWDFGDGAPLFHGFNAAHVYETPGTFTATLTVVTRDGQTAQATQIIEVLQPNGTTYYVDSEIGSDANPGTTPELPWKSATKAFTGMNTTAYNPGDRILFRRGQTFNLEAGLVRPGGGMAGYGYYFGAFGEGPKPIIKHVGTSNAEMIKINGNFLAFWGVMDLAFDCKSVEGQVSSFFINVSAIANIFFLRCDIYNHFQAVGMNGDHLARQITNVYIIKCNIHDSIGVDAMHLYTKASRYANIDSTFDMCDDHVGYHSYLNKAIFSGNVYTRWAFGRLAIRSCGVTDRANPTNNVHIINNRFQGWIDPKIDTWAHTGRGVRYNLCAVELGPNKGLDQSMEYGLIEKNVFADVEKFIEVGVWEHVIIRNNSFSTVSGSAGNVRFQIGHPFEHRPVKDIQIYDNTIVSNENRAGTAAIFFVNAYVGPVYPERALQEDIYIARNRVTLLNGDARLITMGTQKADQIAEVTSNANTVYGATQTQPIFQCGGTYNLPGATYNIAEWRLLTGNDRATLILSPTNTKPLPGAASSPAQCETVPIPVDYEGALCVNDSGLKSVHLWVRKDAEAWADTGLSLPAARGTFLYSGVSGSGTYHFATVAQDNTGAFSPVPTDFGHTTTTYQELGGADTTAPWPATCAAPAFASAAPIAVYYNGASDMGSSGFKGVHLWVRKNDEAWTDSGLFLATAEGTFQYNGMSGDGVYHFAARSEDNAGNLSPEPTGTGDVTTVFDTLPPAAGTLSAPGLVKAAMPVSVTYSGAGDGGSGLKLVVLWVRKDSGEWVATDQLSSSASGTFGYAPASSGTYYFDLVAIDNAGLSSPTPTGNGQGYLVYDLDPPVPGSVNAPATTDRTPISVEYAGAQDALSGLKAVHLWVKKGAAGAWTPTGLSSAASADVFAYEGVTENDTYFFAVQAEDNAGNMSAQPSGAGMAATSYGHVFKAGTASSPATASAAPIAVTYSGAFDSNDNGISMVHLWVKKGAGAWTESGLSLAAASGTFSYSPSAEDTYAFALQAQNSAGAKTEVPAGAGDCVTLYDTSAPTGGAVNAQYYNKTSPVTINYSGMADTGSGLKSVSLWIRKYPASWFDTGMKQPGASGSFSYTITSGSGTYSIGLVAEDNAGNTSAVPTGRGLTNVIYDVTVPVAGTLTAPATTGTTPIAISYSGS
ncbi:MAG: PKD domain-containing protein, partial [FCB group bacterium]|nr:PKD domain-containing protein [FCB group bacterium]